VKCVACQQTFRFSFTARAHLRFRCKQLSRDDTSFTLLSTDSKVKDTDDNAKNNNSMTSLYTPTESVESIKPPLKRRHTSGDNDNPGVTKIPCHATDKISPQTHGNVTPGDEDGGMTSAFRKVTSITGLSPPAHLPLSPSNVFPPLVTSANFSPLHECVQSMLTPYTSLPTPRTALLDVMLASKLPPDNISELLKLTSDSGSMVGTTSARALSAQWPLTTGQFTANRLRAILPFYRPANPMVEKMLHTNPAAAAAGTFPSLNLSQNWCAKCNASFRMTSDLVYHMRSHHSREHDTVAMGTTRKKRDDKLTCEFCGEIFRERHHLTRHMTSHAEIRHA
jgi:hypothetical protein